MGQLLSLSYDLHNQPGRVPPTVNLKEGTASLLLSFKVAFSDSEFVDDYIQLSTTGMAVITGVQPDGDFMFIRAHITELTLSYLIVSLTEQDVQLLSAVAGSYKCRIWILDTEYTDSVNENNYKNYPVIAVQPFVCRIHESAWGMDVPSGDIRAVITYMNEDGTEKLGQSIVINGAEPTDAPVPTKNPSDGYIYVFTGWSNTPYGSADPTILRNVLENRTVYAVFDARRVCLVTYYDEDATTILGDELVMSGQACQNAPTPTKASDEEHTYTFIGWAVVPGGDVYQYALANIYQNTNLYAVYGADVVLYTLSYYQEETLLATELVAYGQDAVNPPSPTKEEDVYYTYSFSGWALTEGGTPSADSLLDVTADRDVFACFSGTRKSYVVSYFNEDILLSYETVLAGDDCAETPTPTKPSTVYNYYTFSGWAATPGGEPVSGILENITASKPVFAVFETHDFYYTISYYIDGVLDSTESVKAGDDCEEAPTPTKASTAYYTYTFAGWAAEEGGTVDPSLLQNILADDNLYAVFTSTKRYYTVSYYNYDSSSLGTETVEAGFDCINVPTPTRAPDAGHTYTFSGWATTAGGAVVANATKNILENKSLYAVFTTTITTFLIRYFNETGTTQYSSEQVAYGGNCVSAPIPTKASDAYYTYAFSGWAASVGGSVDPTLLQNITADDDLFAIFAATGRTYTVTYKDWDDSTLSTETVDAGDDCSSAPTPPARTGYAFDGWSNDAGGTASASAIQDILSDKTVYAVYSLIASHTVTYRDYDGTYLSDETVNDGDDAVNAPTPTRQPTQQYTYTFIGWSDTQGSTTVTAGILQNIVSDVTAYAVYTQSVRNYTVSYYMDDGTFISSESVAYGGSAASTPTPTKASDVYYTYSFSGWSDTQGGSVVSGLLTNITADTNAYAVFTATARSYTVSYYDEDGITLLDTESVTAGGNATGPSTTPTKPPDQQYQYTFDGWSTTVGGNVDPNALNNIIGDKPVYAHYAASGLSTFRNYITGETLSFTDSSTTNKITNLRQMALAGRKVNRIKLPNLTGFNSEGYQFAYADLSDAGANDIQFGTNDADLTIETMSSDQPAYIFRYAKLRPNTHVKIRQVTAGTAPNIIFMYASNLVEYNIDDYTGSSNGAIRGYYPDLEVFSAIGYTGTTSPFGNFKENSTKLRELYLSSFSYSSSQDYQSNLTSCADSLEVLDIGSVGTFSTYTLNTLSKLETLILRNATMTERNASTAMFHADSPLQQGTGKIYVPSALISTYEANANWSQYAGQFVAIEGSVYDFFAE